MLTTSERRLTQSKALMVLRNSLYNLFGLGLPLVVAVVAIPALIQGLGVEQFGILTIIWAVVSYFGLFDLGLGRSVTQQVATCVASEDEVRLKGVVGTSTALMFALGIVAALIMLAVAPLLARELTQTSDPDAVTRAFYWMALAMPAIVLTSGYRGILEALGRFGIINAIRLPMGVFTYAGPLVVMWIGYGSLQTISAVLCVGRIIACGLHAHYAKQALPGETRSGNIDRALIRPLLSMGGWITVSNVVSPLMNYTDRLLLGLAVSAPAVAYYATPQELVLRIGIIPSAIAAVLFPIFASESVRLGAGHSGGRIWKYTFLIFVLLFPLTAALAVLAHPLLAIWISPEFAGEATAPLQIMAVAALCSGLAQVPFTMLQGRARADLTAKLHLIELPLYLGLLWFLILEYGIVGAALAWLIRIGADMVAMYCLCVRDLHASTRAWPASIEASAIDPTA
jgi:O-antigen/teichoic acid export membrane protein